MITRYEFTSGAERALRRAFGRMQANAGHAAEPLSAGAVLLGLLDEPECRAALVLARHGIDQDVVLAHWPGLPRELPDAAVLSSACVPFGALDQEVKLALRSAAHRLADLPHPVELATEHLLLGLLAAGVETAEWLTQLGLSADALDAEIHDRYGCLPADVALQDVHALDDPDGVPESEPTGTGDSPGAAPPEAVREPAASATFALREEFRLLRILDAAEDRAREGLRVVEDYVRFALDDRHLTAVCKGIRHDLTAAVAAIPLRRRLAARETLSDVGTSVSTPSEQHRTDTASVVAANVTRLQEALRSLEEFGKVLVPEMSARVEQIRYRTYTLQRAIEATRTEAARLADARLYVLIDACGSAEAFAALASALGEGGAHVVQLREKTLDDRRLLERARLLRQITRETGTLFVMNDRADLAALADADGVHVGQEELTVKDARSVVGADALVGVSTHTIEQARQAVLDGADYIGVGPTFPSLTKSFDSYPGIELVRAVAAEIRLPAFAIGGVTRANLDQIRAAGLHRVAVSSAVTAASDPAAAVRDLLAGLAPPNP